MLARSARQVLNLLDDTPVVPGDSHPPFDRAEEARELLNLAEDELRSWEPSYEPITSSAGGLGNNAMPGGSVDTSANSSRVPTGGFEEENTYGTSASNTYGTSGSNTYESGSNTAVPGSIHAIEDAPQVPAHQEGIHYQGSTA